MAKWYKFPGKIMIEVEPEDWVSLHKFASAKAGQEVKEDYVVQWVKREMQKKFSQWVTGVTNNVRVFKCQSKP